MGLFEMVLQMLLYISIFISGVKGHPYLYIEISINLGRFTFNVLAIGVRNGIGCFLCCIW